MDLVHVLLVRVYDTEVTWVDLHQALVGVFIGFSVGCYA